MKVLGERPSYPRQGQRSHRHGCAQGAAEDRRGSRPAESDVYDPDGSHLQPPDIPTTAGSTGSA